MTDRNRLILMSDEHSRGILGCYGNPVAQTPHLDTLANRGTRFTAAYTPSPLCVPARAAIATGQPIHKTGHWDNAHPYEGTPQGWAHTLRRRDEIVTSIGKLHYRDATHDTGFTAQLLPMHVENGTGDIAGSIRAPLPLRAQSRSLAKKLGPGNSSYQDYDRSIRDAACAWLQNAPKGQRWTLLVSFVSPHFPLIAPPEFYELYADTALSPKQPTAEGPANHPWLQALRGSYAYDNFDDVSRREALRNYYGLVSFLDSNIGAVLNAAETSGLMSTTDVLYFSDHGDNLGERGMWGKSTFFENSVGVPMIYAPVDGSSAVCDTPVSLTDLSATLTGDIDDAMHLMNIANAPEMSERPVLSQYHAAGSPSAAFMLRKGKYKLCHFVGYEPMLFDLDADPEEQNDLAGTAQYAETQTALECELVTVLGDCPETINKRALQDQAALIETHGGLAAVLNTPALSATSAPSDNEPYEP